MSEEQVRRMHDGKGFIAALDQSGGSTPKALKNYGIGEDRYQSEEEMFDMIHQMRTRIIASPSFTSEHILAAILFEMTMDRKIHGKYTADYLIEKSMEYTEMTEKTDSIISRVKEYLDNHYCTAISRNDLADVVYLNPNYLSRLFKREMNTSINSYLIDKRIDKAKSLLEHSDMPVHAVSMEVGYNNFSYFTKLFREKTGQTPNEYRKSMGIRGEEYFLR